MTSRSHGAGSGSMRGDRVARVDTHIPTPRAAGGRAGSRSRRSGVTGVSAAPPSSSSTAQAIPGGRRAAGAAGALALLLLVLAAALARHRLR